MKGLSNYRQFINTWWWGKTITLVSTDGYSTVELQFDDSLPNMAVIKGLMVFTTRQREGYATEMMNICEHIAEKEGAKFLQLSVNKQQDWLKDWYLRLGYTIIQIDEHEFTMIKQIEDIDSHWKPSKGQLDCLDYAIEKAEKDYSPLTNNRIYLTLKALKEKLLKL